MPAVQLRQTQHASTHKAATPTNHCISCNDTPTRLHYETQQNQDARYNEGYRCRNAASPAANSAPTAPATLAALGPLGARYSAAVMNPAAVVTALSGARPSTR